MKKQTFTFCFLSIFTMVFCLYCTQAQAQEWAWMSGSDLVNEAGVYGVQGTADPANVPGARNGVVGWADNDGNVWIFGGFGFAADPGNSSQMNDLWKFDTDNNEWTWMRGADTLGSTGNFGTMGMAAPTNDPPARNRPLFWTDNDGNFWLFGGITASGERINDLWRYEVSSNQWTWMKGSDVAGAASVGVYGTLGVEDPANVPGGRNGSFNWTDSDGNLWLFGGTGFGPDAALETRLNDVWKYSMTTNNWTWMGGSDVNDVPLPAVYGEFRVSDPANTPGARVSSVSWADNDGDFWLFGGGIAGGIQGRTNDLWKYSVASGEWTWMDGDSLTGQAGVVNLDDPGDPSEADNPGGRNGSMSWTDKNNNLWLMGGWGLPVTGIDPGFLNDVWMYSISENLWYFRTGGLAAIDAAGTYGTLGVPDADNTPGGRASGANMLGNDGSLWQFGGIGGGRYSDLWQLSGDILSGVFDVAPINEISLDIYPNPNNGTFSLTYGEGERFEILDSFGRVVSMGVLNNFTSNAEGFTENIELQNLVPGVYFVKIYEQGKIGVKKFILAQ